MVRGCGTSAIQVRAASPALEIEVGAGEDLVHLEDVRTCEHLLGRAVLVGLGEGWASRPGHEVLEGRPPRLYFVVALSFLVLDPPAGLVIEFHRTWSVDFVPNETRCLIDEVNTLPEAILEIDLVALRDGNAVRDDDHRW